MNRRKFISTTLSASAISFVPKHILSSKKLNILVLGGTNFVGPAIVNDLINAGHNLTLFNRGITNPHLFPQLLKIRGDREKGKKVYKTLQQQKWDLVIDVWPSNPQFVAEAAESLQQSAKHYIFISSIAVYRDYRQINMAETAPIIEGESYEEGNYSLNKAICERAVQQYFPENFTILRPGAIVGERDDGVHFPYLIARIKHQKAIIVPDALDPTQLIDVKDVASFLNICVKKKHKGIYNLVGDTIPYKSLIIQIKETLKSEVEIHWLSPKDVVNKFKLSPWADVPFWIPIALDPEPGFYQISNELAKEKGLKFLPLAQTIKDALTSIDLKTFTYGEGAGISLEREREIIRLVDGDR